MNVLIVSLKFHPGHFSHLAACCKLYKEAGHESYLYVNEKFFQMDEGEEFRKIKSRKDFEKGKNIDLAIFWFPSLKNIPEMLALRIFHRAKVYYVYHEPFDSLRNYYNSGFGIKKILSICLIGLIHIPMLKIANGIILPSKKAFETYRNKYSFLNGKFMQSDLIFDDEFKGEMDQVEKKYISYIGTVAEDHAFVNFVDFVEAAVQNEWLYGLKFLIATSSTIPSDRAVVLESLVKAGRVVLVAGKSMKNSEINEYYCKSLVVWNAYNRSMQSGVLPKAYMFGASVVMLNRNSNEYMENLKTGVLINKNSDIFEIKNALEEILNNKANYFYNCRNKFLSKFYYKNKMKEYINFTLGTDE